MLFSTSWSKCCGFATKNSVSIVILRTTAATPIEDHRLAHTELLTKPVVSISKRPLAYIIVGWQVVATFVMLLQGKAEYGANGVVCVACGANGEHKRDSPRHARRAR
jgi:hypothetical protein